MKAQKEREANRHDQGTKKKGTKCVIFGSLFIGHQRHDTPSLSRCRCRFLIVFKNLFTSYFTLVKVMCL